MEEIFKKGSQLLFKVSYLRAGKRGIYKPNFTPSEGNLPERKEGVCSLPLGLREK
jgi:hypothetical protein